MEIEETGDKKGKKKNEIGWGAKKIKIKKK
jgi:hypothetical protein